MPFLSWLVKSFLLPTAFTWGALKSYFTYLGGTEEKGLNFILVRDETYK